MPWSCGSYRDRDLRAIGWDSFVFEHHYCSCCVGTKHFYEFLSAAERPTQRKLSQRPQSNRMESWGRCGMCCKEALTWFRAAIAPFLLSHWPRILYSGQVLGTIICLAVDSAPPADTLIWSGLYRSTGKNTACLSVQRARCPFTAQEKLSLPLNAPVRSSTNRLALQPCGLHVPFSHF